MKIENIVYYAIFAAIIFAAFHYGGSMDREEHAIATMSQSEYNEIKDSLQIVHNSTPSDGQIANEWYKKKGE